MNKIFERKIVNIFLPISVNICFGAQKNRLIETVLVSLRGFFCVPTMYVLVEK